MKHILSVAIKYSFANAQINFIPFTEAVRSAGQLAFHFKDVTNFHAFSL